MMVSKSMSPRVSSMISANVVMPSDDAQGPILSHSGAIRQHRTRVQPCGLPRKDVPKIYSPRRVVLLRSWKIPPGGL